MGEFWDNNDGRNYRIGFKKVAAPTNSPLSTPRAPQIQVSASFPPSFSREKKAASFSAIPHVSTFGPARYAAHKQQPTFNPPTAMKFTPTSAHRSAARPVLSRIAVSGANAIVNGDDDNEEEEDEKEKVVVVSVPGAEPSPPFPPADDDEEEEEKSPIEREVESTVSAPPVESSQFLSDATFSDRTPLLRRHSTPDHPPRFPLPQPIIMPKHDLHSREPSSDGSKPTSPVEAYIAKKLTLRNYVAPGSRPSSTVPSPEIPKATLHEEEMRSTSASPSGIVTPPTTPPRETQLKGLPDVGSTEPDEEKEDAQAILSPLVMSGTCSFNSGMERMMVCSRHICAYRHLAP